MKASIGGGWSNYAPGYLATVPGGAGNQASGARSFAAGYRAKAFSDGSFVWADSQDADFQDMGGNSFNVRAAWGAYFLGNNEYQALSAVNQYSGGYGVGVYADTASWYSGYFIKHLWVESGCENCALVYLGLSDGGEPLEPGDVVAASGLGDPLTGTGEPVMRVRRAEAGSAVIGVVQGRATVGDSKLDGHEMQMATGADGAAQPGDHLFLIVHGITQVKVDASAGAIAVGQRLTAADRAGHARALQTRTLDGMVVTEGAPVVGIALAALDSGTGLISVFVTLH